MKEEGQPKYLGLDENGPLHGDNHQSKRQRKVLAGLRQTGAQTQELKPRQLDEAGLDELH